MRIGAFDAVNNVTDGNTCEECAASATLLNADDAQSRCTAGRVVERWIIAGQRVWSAQRHKDAISAG
jgi:hypothetical protein